MLSIDAAIPSNRFPFSGRSFDDPCLILRVEHMSLWTFGQKCCQPDKTVREEWKIGRFNDSCCDGTPLFVNHDFFLYLIFQKIESEEHPGILHNSCSSCDSPASVQIQNVGNMKRVSVTRWLNLGSGLDPGNFDLHDQHGSLHDSNDTAWHEFIRQKSSMGKSPLNSELSQRNSRILMEYASEKIDG